MDWVDKPRNYKNFYGILQTLRGSHLNNFPRKTLKIGWVAVHSETFQLKCLDFRSNQYTCKKLVPLLSRSWRPPGALWSRGHTEYCVTCDGLHEQSMAQSLANFDVRHLHMVYMTIFAPSSLFAGNGGDTAMKLRDSEDGLWGGK